MSFLALGSWLLRAGLYFVRTLNAKMAYTDRDKALAWATTPFDVPKEMAKYLTVMIVAFAYVIISPLTCLLGAFYFNMRYFIDKYNICCVFYFDFESKGATAKYALSFVLIAICTFQVIGGLMIMQVGHDAYFAVGAIIIVIGIVLLILGLCAQEKLFKDKEPPVYNTDSINSADVRKQYTHPLQDKTKEDFVMALWSDKGVTELAGLKSSEAVDSDEDRNGNAKPENKD
jgi:hypothetical protein